MRKKLLIIVENLPVPFDGRVWKEALSLKAGGDDVTVLCPRRKGYSGRHDVIDGIPVYRHPLPREKDSPVGYLIEYVCAIFWEFVYAVWIYVCHGFEVIQGCNPPDDIFLVALPFKLFGSVTVSIITTRHPVLLFEIWGKGVTV